MAHPRLASGLAAPGSRAEQVAAAFLAGYRPSTRSAYWRSLRAWAGWCAAIDQDLLAVRRCHVELWLGELEELGAAAATRKLHLAALAGFYTEAVNQGVIAQNPVARLRRPTVSHDTSRPGLDRSQAREVLVAAQKAGARDHALICLLLYCGLRISEALSVAAGDITTVRGHPVARVVRKGGARSDIALPPPAVVAVSRLLEERGLAGPSAPLFIDRSGQRLDRFDAVRIVRRLGRAAGIGKRLSPHSLRHTFVVLALDAGAPLRDVQDSAGHADPRTTRRYSHDRDTLDRFAGYHVAEHLAGRRWPA